MGMCFDTGKFGPFCIGDTFSQLGESGIGLTESGLGLFAIVAASVVFFIVYSPSRR